MVRICYECGKEIQIQTDMVLKEFRVAGWGVRWIKPFMRSAGENDKKLRGETPTKLASPR